MIPTIAVVEANLKCWIMSSWPSVAMWIEAKWIIALLIAFFSISADGKAWSLLASSWCFLLSACFLTCKPSLLYPWSISSMSCCRVVFVSGHLRRLHSCWRCSQKCSTAVIMFLDQAFFWSMRGAPIICFMRLSLYTMHRTPAG